MLFTETISVYSENHTKPTSTLFGQNAELLIVKADEVRSLQYTENGAIMRRAAHETKQFFPLQ
jgi:hypothetical protein